MAGDMFDTLVPCFALERSTSTAMRLVRRKSFDTFCWNSIATFSYQHADQLGLRSAVQSLRVQHKRERHTKVPRMLPLNHNERHHKRTLLTHLVTIR